MEKLAKTLKKEHQKNKHTQHDYFNYIIAELIANKMKTKFLTRGAINSVKN